eukprot:632282-Amphidinium_carterae.1
MDADAITALVRAIVAAQQGEGVDSRSIRHPGDFSGKDEDWPGWCFRWEAFTSLMGMEDEMSAALSEPPDRLLLSAFTEEAKVRAKKLYNMLSTSVKGKALLKVRGAERGNGYDAWVKLKQEYEPRLGSRRTGMLIGLLNPAWTEGANKGKEFVDLLAEWEDGVQRYETEIAGQLAEDIKIAVVVRAMRQSL